MKKTITVDRETWKNLHLLKFAMTVDTIDDVINKLILNYNTQKKEDKKDGELKIRKERGKNNNGAEKQ